MAVAAPSLVTGLDLPLGPGGFANLVLLHDTHDLWPIYLRDVVGRAPAVLRRGMRFSQTSLSIDAALAGQGAALASRFLVDRDITAGRLVEVGPGALRDARDFCLLAPRGRRRNAATDSVVDWLLSFTV